MRKAVVVDDDPITRLDLADILSRAGFAVAGQGADGFDAVDLCDTHRPDLVLMDVKMPVFDGLDAARTIADRNLAGCIVLVTAFNDPEFIAKAKEFGVSGYLVKPVDERTLLPAVEIAMAQSSRYRQVKGENDSIRQKLEDKNLVDRAKALLAAKEGIGESEAYALLRKTAMAKSLSMAAVARSVVGASDDKAEVDKVKKLLMDRLGMSENAAFRRIRERAAKQDVSLRRAARDIATELGE